MKISDRQSLVATLLVTTFCVTVGSRTAWATPTRTVPRQAMLSLIPGPDELPWSLILSSDTTGPEVTRFRFQTLSGSKATQHRWAGNPHDRGGPLKRELQITVAIADSAGQAVAAAVKDVNSASVSMPDETGDPRFASFTDRAWFSNHGRSPGLSTGASMVFVRGNVLASVVLIDMDGFENDVLVQTALRLGRRIDAAAAGKPLPIPILPPSVEDMRCGPEEAWDAYQAVRAFGKNATTIVVRNSQGEPRAVPAYIDNGSYMVPLRYLVAATHPGTRVKVDRVATDVTWSGRHLVFAKGDARLTVDGKATPLRKPAVVKRGQIMVPLSIVETVLGRQITWSTSQGKKMARF